MSQPPEGFRAALDAAFRDAGRSQPMLIGLESIPGGSINQTFMLRAASGVYFCKWNPAAPAGMFRREAEGLAALAAAAGNALTVPKSVALSPDQPANPALLVLEYLEPDADGPSRRTWELLGRGLAELHQSEEGGRGRTRDGGARYGFERDNFCGLTAQENGWTGDWAAFYAQKRIGALVDRLAGRGDLAPAEIRDYGKLIDRLPNLLAHNPAPSLLHGDLWSGNFLAAAVGPALVDPAVYCGDREAEWGMMSLFGGFPDTVLAAYQERWPLPEGWMERRPLYQLYHLLNHFLLFGGGYGAQAIAIARRFL